MSFSLLFRRFFLPVLFSKMRRRREKRNQPSSREIEIKKNDGASYPIQFLQLRFGRKEKKWEEEEIEMQHQQQCRPSYPSPTGTRNGEHHRLEKRGFFFSLVVKEKREMDICNQKDDGWWWWVETWSWRKSREALSLSFSQHNPSYMCGKSWRRAQYSVGIVLVEGKNQDQSISFWHRILNCRPTPPHPVATFHVEGQSYKI